MVDWIKNPTNIVTISSAIIALASAFFAYHSLRVANKSYRISLSQDNRSNLPINAELGSGSRITTKEGQLRCYKVLIRNPSTSSNSIAKAELKIRYSDDQSNTYSLILPQANMERIKGFQLDTPPTILPLFIESGKSTQGNLVFFARAELVRDFYIEDYTILLEDSLGRICEVVSITAVDSKNHQNSKEDDEAQG